MPTIALTMKLHLRPSEEDALAFGVMSKAYMEACNFVAQYAFDNGCFLSVLKLHKALYQTVRSQFGLKAQLAASVFRTVVARYKAVREQLWQSPFRYKDENGEWKSITRNLNWIQHPVQFHRPQADLVRNRDYSFVQKGNKISVNTLGKRAIMAYDAPECFAGFFDGSWTFGTGKLVLLVKNRLQGADQFCLRSPAAYRKKSQKLGGIVADGSELAPVFIITGIVDFQLIDGKL